MQRSSFLPSRRHLVGDTRSSGVQTLELPGHARRSSRTALTVHSVWSRTRTCRKEGPPCSGTSARCATSNCPRKRVFAVGMNDQAARGALLYSTALEYTRCGEFDAARAAFEECVRCSPDFARAWVSYAQVGSGSNRSPGNLRRHVRQHLLEACSTAVALRLHLQTLIADGEESVQAKRSTTDANSRYSAERSTAEPQECYTLSGRLPCCICLTTCKAPIYPSSTPLDPLSLPPPAVPIRTLLTCKCLRAWFCLDPDLS